MLKPVNVGYATADAVAVHARFWDGGSRQLGCVVAHGFTGSSANPNVERICRALAGGPGRFGVLSPDFRGHGRSGGGSTAGELEVLDVAAAVDWLRAAGFAKIAVLGWSMGGSAVLRYAGAPGAAPTVDAVVSVSSPGMWFERGTRPMRIVHWALEKRLGRLAVRLTRRTRIDATSWKEIPEAPHEVVGAIEAPLLLVHGDADHYFPMRHIEALAAAAPNATVWIEPGMAHAESGTSAELMERIVDWLLTATQPIVPTVCDDGARG